MGYWREIKPKVKREHPWLFGYYQECPSERADNKWFGLFLFRDRGRKVFGVCEFIGDTLHTPDLRHLATRTVLEHDLRKSMISDDPDLPKWWKRH